MLRLLMMLNLFIVSFGVCSAPITVTDVVGRSVTLEKPASRFIISEGRYVLTLGLLRPENPVEGLVGMMQPIGWAYPDLEEQVLERFPEAKDIQLYGKIDETSVSVEKIIALEPELAIFGIEDHGPGAKNKELLDQLEKTGTKVVFIDFRMNPLKNTVPSIQLLGKVLGAEKHAERFVSFYQKKRTHIENAVEKISSRPTVFLQAHAGRFPCCVGMADGMLGPFVEKAGGLNIADAVAPGPVSRHTMEFLLEKDPDIWITTASGTVQDYQNGKSYVAIGPGMNGKMAEDSLTGFLSAPEFQAMTAVSSGRAYSIWHDFYNSPFNLVVLEALASWIHPEQFPDADPEQTIRYIYEEFLPYQWDGVITAQVKPAS